MIKDSIFKIFTKIPTLESERLILRRMKLSDADDMYEYAKDPDVTKYLTWDIHPSIMYTKRYLEYVQKQYSDGQFYDWAVTLKENGKMIGTCGFTSFDLHNNSAEAGYVINPLHRGKGYAPEALFTVMNFGFMKLNLHRIQARCMDGNAASAEVMKKCGMKYEGCAESSMFIKGIYRSIHTYAIISDEYIKTVYSRPAGKHAPCFDKSIK